MLKIKMIYLTNFSNSDQYILELIWLYKTTSGLLTTSVPLLFRATPCQIYNIKQGETAVLYPAVAILVLVC